MMVVGEAEIVSIIEDEPEIVWELTSDYSGIAKEFLTAITKIKTKQLLIN